MSVTLSYATNLTVQEVLVTNVPAAAATGKTITHNGYNSSASLTSATTPPVTQCAFFEQALTAGAASIDLTALPGTNGATVDGSGLKVQAIKIKAKSTNANVITVTVGDANGYALAGAGFSVALLAGQEFVFYGNEATPDVGADAKTLDLDGTDEQSVEVSVAVG